jgi:hypothetical protein
VAVARPHTANRLSMREDRRQARPFFGRYGAARRLEAVREALDRVPRNPVEIAQDVRKRPVRCLPATPANNLTVPPIHNLTDR